jgi:hypothetical protein
MEVNVNVGRYKDEEGGWRNRGRGDWLKMLNQKQKTGLWVITVCVFILFFGWRIIYLTYADLYVEMQATC